MNLPTQGCNAEQPITLAKKTKCILNTIQRLLEIKKVVVS